MSEVNIFSDMCFNEEYIRSFITSKINIFLTTKGSIPEENIIVNTINPLGEVKTMPFRIGSYYDFLEVLRGLNYIAEEVENDDKLSNFDWVIAAKLEGSHLRDFNLAGNYKRSRCAMYSITLGTK